MLNNDLPKKPLIVRAVAIILLFKSGSTFYEYFNDNEFIHWSQYLFLTIQAAYLASCYLLFYFDKFALHSYFLLLVIDFAFSITFSLLGLTYFQSEILLAFMIKFTIMHIVPASILYYHRKAFK